MGWPFHNADFRPRASGKSWPVEGHAPTHSPAVAPSAKSPPVSQLDSLTHETALSVPFVNVYEDARPGVHPGLVEAADSARTAGADRGAAVALAGTFANAATRTPQIAAVMPRLRADLLLDRTVTAWLTRTITGPAQPGVDDHSDHFGTYAIQLRRRAD
jgi:hypothetical protein